MWWKRSNVTVADLARCDYIAARCGWTIYEHPTLGDQSPLLARSHWEPVVFQTDFYELDEEAWNFLYEHPAPQTAGGYYPDGTKKE